MIAGKKKFFLLVSIVLLGFGAGCLIAEFYLRIATPSWLSKEMNDLNLARNMDAFGSSTGWSVEKIDGRFVRFVPLSQSHVRYYEYDHQVHIDALGNRFVATNPSKSAPVIPFLGDSFVFGVGAKDEETFVSLLSAQSPYQFLNLGVPGSALPNHLDQIEFRHKELHSPSVYVFSFYTGNDYADIFNYHGKLDPQKEMSGDKNTIPGWLVEWMELNLYRNHFLSKSYLLQFVKRTVLRNYFYATHLHRSILPLECLAVQKGPHAITSSSLLIMAARKGCISELTSSVKLTLDHLLMLSKRMKFKPVFVIIPDQLQTRQSLLESKAARWKLEMSDLDIDQPTRIIENELRSDGIPFIDISECLKEREDAYYKIDGHFTPVGHRIVAQYLLPKLNAILAELRSSAEK
jgi:hypothetical protein